MAKLKYRMIPEGMLNGKLIPLNIVLIDYKDVKDCGLEPKAAFEAIAKTIDAPAGLNIIDLDAVTTTSDGIVVEGAIIRMAASDRGRINKDFGYLEMIPLNYTDEDIKREPHLKVWKDKYPERTLYMGPDYRKKKIPVHNVVITGRAANNNSATEMMNIVTMEEILLPILGQLEIMKDGKVLLGNTGEIISVGIGMVVPEEYGRIVPKRQYMCGDTAHGSGEYAKTLKKHIPIICVEKPVLARYIIQALECGMVPGRTIGGSPAVLTVAKYLHKKIDFDNITKKAYEELASIGFTKEYLHKDFPLLTAEEIIKRADELIPGCEDYKIYDSKDIVKIKYAEC
ncbi:MAG: hypothetical protein LKJ25_09550 [Clostridia bacterium]|jgi:hypothetical protein|nr:hypothetical protein [Clostridia bacterium]